MHGAVSTYFEAAAVITTLVLLGQVLELRARQQTSGAIRSLLNLAPKQAHMLRATARSKMSRSNSSNRATGCASVRERAFRLTA